MASSSVAAANRLVSARGGTELLVSRHSDVERPSLDPRLKIRKLVLSGEVTFAVRNPDTYKILVFDESNWRVIELFDGTRTRPEMVEEYNRRYPDDRIELQTILDFEDAIGKMELLDKSTTVRNLQLMQRFRDARKRAADEKAEGFNIFFIMFHVVDPNRFLNRTVKYVRWIWTLPAFTVFSIFAMMTTWVFLRDFPVIWAQTIELYSFLKKPFWDIVQFFIILTSIGCIHEYAHAYATKINGGDVHDIGLALFYFTPAFYCDTSDHLMFQNKWHRLMVPLAGIYIESILCCAATGAWLVTYPDTLLHELAYKTMLYTGISTVFFNINPMIKTDGYHALSHLLEMPDLREDSFQYVGAWIQKKIFRLPVELPLLSERKRRAYLIYGTLALLYTGAIMDLIAHVFYSIYFRLVPDLAVVLLIVTLYRIYRQRIRIFFRFVRLLYLDKKELVMSRRIRTPLVACAVGAALLLLVPWSHESISTDAVLRPVRTFHALAPSSGVIDRVAVHSGDSVVAGQTIAVIRNRELETEAERLASEVERLAREANAARSRGDIGALGDASQKLTAAQTALDGVNGRRGALVLRAPFAGRVMTPHVEDAAGKFVAAGTLVADVGDCRQLVAELPFSERFLTYVRRSQEAVIQLSSMPMKPVHGSVQSVSAAGASEELRSAAAESTPGDMPERFVALATFDNRSGQLLPGMRGHARIYTQRSSLLGRAWRIGRDFVETIVW